MDWEIFSFLGMGPIKFGMSPQDVTSILGEPKNVRDVGTSRRESRDITLPIVRYVNKSVSEIEAFYTVPNVSFIGTPIFEENGRQTLRFLEERNGGARIDVGIILFNSLGITIGRIDEDARGEHSVTAFVKGFWDDDISEFKQISFK